MTTTMMMMMMMMMKAVAVPTTSPSEEQQSKAQTFLSTFFSDVGVGGPDSVRRSSLDSFDDALKKMQEFYGLHVTGRLDSNTLEVMDRPRCGVADVTRYSHFHGGPRWDRRVLTYRVTDYTADLTHDEVDAVLAKALKLYSDVTPLEFKKTDGDDADIIVKFKAQDHGDFAPFDGPGGVLAHAFSPGIGHGGDTHFDEDETWTLSSEGSNLFVVAAHEFGHALGLAHSQLQTALMYPTYQYVNPDGYTLPDDDREGVQALYGVRGSAEPEATPTPQPLPDRCDTNLEFDAATEIQGNLYFFKDGYVWKKNSLWEGISIRSTSSVWAGLSRVDAAYEYKRDNVVYFFTGSEFRAFRGNAALPGYPKAISHFGFPSSVTSVHAAVHVTFTSRTLFFVGNKFWSYDERRGRMDRGYPKYIFRELPRIGFRVDAAFEYKGYLYFTNGHRQTEYHYSRRRAVRKLLNNQWMDCY